MPYDYGFDDEIVTARRRKQLRPLAPAVTTQPTERTVVYADASHAPTCRHAYGYGISIVGHGDPRHISGVGLMPKLFADNHLAELLAACIGLNMALELSPPESTLRLLSDSVNALCMVAGHVTCSVEGDGHVGQAAQYNGKRKRFNLRMSPMRTLNVQASALLARAQKTALEKGVLITLQHIAAHTGRHGEGYRQQHICDSLARCARWHAEKLANRGRLVHRA